ncbi:MULTISPECIES: flagellar motor switch protein FliG [Vibrio]|uniref:Flagellar motor switch protein FliG n=1 Tax=Vibrio proteolyticus NBRC 13287 TaxID=1219065 RepID=U2ZEU3_VIBPR|nr:MULTISPECIES: flagellar motor switch protein FliG [Vibrio]NAW59938.1 flagellar motor switch protein FliG [Vibrio sp. V36_P2S2PM302]NAX21940.1 flagellar motor switch protein FliG [Vibrio sp. V39_P1S14PM300]NAX26396.1 flagellar motor switch protein FliG [Vibrio sp. V38_P2S17PM301]NAX30339.1 flagellar motor switch protein FliG [Vibrio sp. V37_P2S8PM304]GAD66216.1 flagellar motor switch protein FliG [Vibrio proteolyticus NBRC 13287]
MSTAKFTRKQTLSYVEQTALVLLGMGEDAAAKVLRHFSRDETQRVTKAMAKLSGIKSDSARNVIQNFFEDFRQHSGIRGASKEYLSNTLRKALGNDLAKGLLNNLYGDEIRNNMQRLQWVESETLARFITNEHPQMQAIFLAYLPPESSSEVLKFLPEDYHDELLFRIARLQDVDHQVAKDLSELIERCIEKVSANQSAPLSGVKQAADIINRFEGDRAGLMEMLKLHDEDVVSEIEQNMFEFMVLGRQREETMDLLVQQVPLDLWALALKGADITLQQAIKRSMPQRMASALEENMQSRGAVPLSKVESARQEIMQIVRTMDDGGEIELLLYEEPTVE